ncbi:MAG TPA: hypothetical protein VFI70_02175, partial [Nitrososphaeraceae archaeon]|nr:hypothetical protein [Nitrososphaeraceae archaeon]
MTRMKYFVLTVALAMITTVIVSPNPVLGKKGIGVEFCGPISCASGSNQGAKQFCENFFSGNCHN